ncbi:MAG: protein kinase [Bryobacteraceae bacterium]|nr:protein kinase [Bryobacteraceae bacterium]
METIGRYRILGELGRGAMGIVYRAQDPAIGREIAIKTIRLSELADSSERSRLRDRLLREAQSAGILSHPGIVTIYDVAEEGDIAYIAMELVDGPTLDRLVATDPPDGALVLSLLAQTATALDYAHKRGIVHRDIKPANIMIDDRRTAKITDFGVAKFQSHQLTQAGSMVGTPNYMSPEQIQGQDVDGRADQFSLAVITYQLLTGEKPFVGDSIAALAYRIVREEPEPIHRLNPTLEWPVDTVLRRALAKSPADRYPTCSEFAFALGNACRACRKWKPLPAGEAHEMATLWVTATSSLAAARGPSLPPDQEVTRPLDAVVPRDPLPLRLLRTFAVIVVTLGLLAAAIVGGLHYLQIRQEQKSDIANAPPSQPVGPTGPTAIGELPGEKKSDSAEEPVAEAVETAVVRPPTTSTPATDTALPTTPEARLVTNPAGAFLVVDGSSELSCQSPCSLPLAAGRHTLAATMTGFRRTLRILSMPADSQVFINMERQTGTIMVRSDPRGASILVNGQTRTEKTPAMLTLPTGNYTLEVLYEGQRETHEVIVKDAAITNLAVNFGK